MSALPPESTHRAVSLDHLVGCLQEGFRDCEAERFGGLEVYDQFKSGGCLDREVSGLIAL